MSFRSLTAISPIDGRYISKTNILSPYFSEMAFNKYRLFIEIQYLIFLIEKNIIKFPETDTDPAVNYKDILSNIYEGFDLDECIKLKKIEDKINHDVKAIEYYIRDKMKDMGIEYLNNYVHIGLTSQDINSSANMLMIKESIEKVMAININEVCYILETNFNNWKDIGLLSKTHGQTATPTTVGKEMMVFNERLVNQLINLKSLKCTTKFGCATGNLNALHYAYPEEDWMMLADQFICKLGLTRNHYTTQIDHYDNYTAIFDCLKRINIILIDLCQDMWLYISRNVFIQKINPDEVGSSTMPFKINPINFENAEGNFYLSISMLELFSRKLPVSRMQRDLTDSTILRNVGSAFSYMLIGLTSLITGLNKLELNKKQIKKELDDNYVVVTEAIQTRLKVLGVDNAYEKMKEITRNYGDNTTIRSEIQKFIQELNISDTEKKYLMNIDTSNYMGTY